jgi:hypothetical protein
LPIIVAVILIIAAIAISNFVRSMLAANEASASKDLRNITTAEYLHYSAYRINFSAWCRKQEAWRHPTRATLS